MTEGLQMLKSWLVLGLLFVVVVDGSVDRTCQSGAAGSDVVDAVISLMEASCVFPEHRQFLRRLAYVESSDGNADNTYRAGYDGGIWQVDCSNDV